MARSLPAALLVTCYALALVVALRDPSEHLLAGLVVLTGLTTRTAVRLLRVATRRTRPTESHGAVPAPVPLR